MQLNDAMGLAATVTSLDQGPSSGVGLVMDLAIQSIAALHSPSIDYRRECLSPRVNNDFCPAR
eukprot:scaffold10665_cov21-Tisochrysis_lutea.AAC.1